MRERETETENLSETAKEIETDHVTVTETGSTREHTTKVEYLRNKLGIS
jgi:hypothetical protein